LAIDAGFGKRQRSGHRQLRRFESRRLGWLVGWRDERVLVRRDHRQQERVELRRDVG
jgi:hypothetical protein